MSLGKNRQQSMRVALILDGMAIDWTHKRAKLMAARGLMDALGIHEATAYRYIGDYLAVKTRAYRQQNPAFWMFGQEARK